MSSSVPPLLANATRDLARFAAETRPGDIPAAVIERVKLSVLDGLGVCLHGSTLPWTERVRDVVLEEGGHPIASIWNTGVKTALTGAVLVNSTAGHAFEMDDIYKESILHPNSLAVPTALALAEADPTITGRDVTTAIALGARRSASESAMPRHRPSSSTAFTRRERQAPLSPPRRPDGY